MIVDLSHPKGDSVNDWINPSLRSLTYTSVDKAADRILQLGRGALIAKSDIQSAYRIVPVHPEDRWLLGMEWRNNIYGTAIWADALEWMLHKLGVEHNLHYLDDFLFLGKSDSEECDRALRAALQIFAELGVSIAPDKVKGPLTVLEFLGIILDSIKLELRLPHEKLTQLKRMVKQWSYRKVCTKRELLSLIGHVSHACKVIKPGRQSCDGLLSYPQRQRNASPPSPGMG